MRALGLSPPSLLHLKVMPDEVGTGEGLPATSRARTERLAARQRMQRRPPPSMWTAPQSQIPPPNPADAPSPERAATYFRRVSAANMVNGPMPTRGQRIANVAGGVLGVTLGLYMVLLHDFGTHEHVFMPVSLRRGRFHRCHAVLTR
jgi:hypothetical protein